MTRKLDQTQKLYISGVQGWFLMCFWHVCFLAPFQYNFLSLLTTHTTFKSGIGQLSPDLDGIEHGPGVGRPKHVYQHGLGLLGCLEVQIQFF